MTSSHHHQLPGFFSKLISESLCILLFLIVKKLVMVNCFMVVYTEIFEMTLEGKSPAQYF
jgi:hypothetical protein